MNSSSFQLIIFIDQTINFQSQVSQIQLMSRGFCPFCKLYWKTMSTTCDALQINFSPFQSLELISELISCSKQFN